MASIVAQQVQVRKFIVEEASRCVAPRPKLQGSLVIPASFPDIGMAQHGISAELTACTVDKGKGKVGTAYLIALALWERPCNCGWRALALWKD